MENTLVSKPSTRPESIDLILNSLDRYNPENIKVFSDYVTTQCGDGTVDIVANLALLKLYQFNIHELKEDVIIRVLTKALLSFYTADFSTALHLLPPYVTTTAEPETDSLSDQCQRLLHLYTLLDSARYSEFWSEFEKDDTYADLVADVVGFEDEVRLSIAKTVRMTFKKISVQVFQDWSNLSSDLKFSEWITSKLGWTIDKSKNQVIVPLNKDNDAKPVVTSEQVRFEQLSRLIKRSYELESRA